MRAVSLSSVRDPNKNKMAGVNSRFADVSQSKILRIQKNAVPENTMRATKFDLKVFKGKRRLQTLENSAVKFVIFR